MTKPQEIDLDRFEAAFEFLVKAIEVFCARSYLKPMYGGPPVLGEEPETKRVRLLGWERGIVDGAASLVDGVPWDGVVDVKRDWSLLLAGLDCPLQLLAEAVRKAASPVVPFMMPTGDSRGLMIFPRFPFRRAGETVKSFSRWDDEVREFAEDVRLAIERAKQEAGTRKTGEATVTVDKPTGRMRGPSERQKMIAKYYEDGSKTQADVAAVINEKRLLGKKAALVNQWDVSRAIKAVNRQRKRDGLPPIETRRGRMRAIDPERIELGERQDGRAKRQRERRSD